jgi:betaine/carnitine transporter, BCCT family
VFFVTSSDSGSLVIDTITAGGKVNAPVSQRIFWASFEGVVAITLLLGGGLGALQAASVSTGLPFALVLLLGCVALVKGLLTEPRTSKAKTVK